MEQERQFRERHPHLAQRPGGPTQFLMQRRQKSGVHYLDKLTLLFEYIDIIIK